MTDWGNWKTTVYFSYGAIRGGAPYPVGKVDVTVVPRERAEGEEPFRITRYHNDEMEERQDQGKVIWSEIVELLITQRATSPNSECLQAADVRIETYESHTSLHADARLVTSVAKKALALLLRLQGSFDRMIMVLHPVIEGELSETYTHRLVRSGSTIPPDVDILYVPSGCAFKLVCVATNSKDATRPEMRVHVGLSWEAFVEEIFTKPSAG